MAWSWLWVHLSWPPAPTEHSGVLQLLLLSCSAYCNYKQSLGSVAVSLQALLRKECGLELAVGPAQLATSAYWTLRGASAFVAGKLGTTVTHVLQQHSMLHMTKV